MDQGRGFCKAMKKYYKVSFHYNDFVYCTNLVLANSREEVEEKYSKYDWFSITDAYYWDIAEAEKKGMPIIEL
ncbi:MAG: hypothetical protein IKO36_05905 [Bacteroidaceae bacterium]|nr:hypothetical protein [Bacteroidaceae bacterium]